MESDESLYIRYRQGDEAALRSLMERYGDKVTRYVNRYVNDLGDSEDLMIEAFSRIVVRNPDFQENGFKSYLYTTARRLALRYRARSFIRRHVSLDTLIDEPQGSAGADALLLQDEQSQALHQCLNRINPDYREALHLLYFEGMSYAEAATAMGKNTRQIANLAHRGKKALRALLEEEGLFETVAEKPAATHPNASSDGSKKRAKPAVSPDAKNQLATDAGMRERRAAR